MMISGYAVYKTAYGIFRITYDEDSITGLVRGISQSSITEEALGTEEASGIRYTENYGTKTLLTEQVMRQMQEYFSGTRKCFDFKMNPQGTDFQKSVWRALGKIPYGETCSYKDIGIAIGKPEAARAVGMANNKNPIHIAIPCHRVIGSNGKLVGYASGVELKEQLLNLEQGNTEMKG